MLAASEAQSKVDSPQSQIDDVQNQIDYHDGLPWYDLRHVAVVALVPELARLEAVKVTDAALSTSTCCPLLSRRCPAPASSAISLQSPDPKAPCPCKPGCASGSEQPQRCLDAVVHLRSLDAVVCHLSAGQVRSTASHAMRSTCVLHDFCPGRQPG